MSEHRRQRKSNRKKRSRGHEGHAAPEGASSTPKQQQSAKPSFQPELLEPRILLSATWIGTEGADVFDGTNAADEAYGLGGDDELHGGKNADVLDGGAGDDQLFGDLGHDTLDGGTGDDQLFGGQGNDILISGGGNDVMDGGSGNDTYQFTGAQDGDVITVAGFSGGQDTVDLSGYGNSQITDDGSTITVDMGGGQSLILP